MNIIQRGAAFLQSLRDLAGRSAWDWRRCPSCGDTLTRKHGTYRRRPWLLDGRQELRIQRHWCHRCRGTYSEQSALLLRGGWYGREVRRCALDHWQYGGTSVRRTAALRRAWLGRQERWRLWQPLAPAPAEADRGTLGASTVQRWLNAAGAQARQTVVGQLAGVPTAGHLATDGLWARLRGGVTRVVLLLTDSGSGVVWPPVVATGEEAPAQWGRLFHRAQVAGRAVAELWGVTSDGATGSAGYLRERLSWVAHQRGVFHLWRNVGGELARPAMQATAGLSKAAGAAVHRQVRRELSAAVRAVLDAPSEAAAWEALAQLAALARGAKLAALLRPHVAAAHGCHRPYTRALVRVSPEWCWRDFRLGLGHGRNHGPPARLERAALRWAIYHNFSPAQERRERKRSYKSAGRSPLVRAGCSPGAVSYLDALAI
jgi:transposase-like protein